MRQTVSSAGADDEPEPDVPVPLDELLELQPPVVIASTAASAAAAAAYAGVFLSPTAGTPSGW